MEERARPSSQASLEERAQSGLSRGKSLINTKSLHSCDFLHLHNNEKLSESCKAPELPSEKVLGLNQLMYLCIVIILTFAARAVARHFHSSTSSASSHHHKK